MSSTIESVLTESRVFPPSAEMVRQANISGMEAYRQMCAEAERDFEGFWARHAREELLWHKPFTKTLDESKAPFFKWFYDGEVNASYNCLDRHLSTQPDKVAATCDAAAAQMAKAPPERMSQLLDQGGKCEAAADCKAFSMCVVEIDRGFIAASPH